MRTAMMQRQAGVADEIDFIEELRLRRWARENYVSLEARDADWHPIVLEEMGRKDREAFVTADNPLASADA